MKPLGGKHILICRSRERSAAFEAAFKKHGGHVHFFSTFKTELFDAKHDEKIATTMRSLSDFDWLILSSKNGVEALAKNKKSLKLSFSILRDLEIGIVGKKTAASFSELFPQKSITLIAHSLQDLLDEIHKAQNPSETTNVIHLSSQQSQENIDVNTPERLELLRFPLYQTMIDNSHSPEEIQHIRSGKFDIIVFTSPTSFDYFMEIIGDDRLISDSYIAVLGDTTKQHIEGRGYKVEIVATDPEAEKLVSSVGSHWELKRINTEA